MKKWLVMIVTVLLGSGVLPLQAQEPVLTSAELKLLEVVVKAQDWLMAQDSFRVQIESRMDQLMTSSSGGFDASVTQQMTQASQVEVLTDGNGNPSAMQMRLEQDTTLDMGVGSPVENSLTTESIFLNGQYYLRFTDLSPELAGVLPVDWINAQDFALMTGMNPSAFANLSGRESLTLYPLSAETVAAVEELAGETLEGQAVRVIQVTWRSDGLLGVPGISNMFDFSQLGLGDDFVQQLFENASVVQVFYVGTEDGLLYRNDFTVIIEDAELNVQGQTIILDQTTTTINRYYDFNAPVKIEKPTLGQ